MEPSIIGFQYLEKKNTDLSQPFLQAWFIPTISTPKLSFSTLCTVSDKLPASNEKECFSSVLIQKSKNQEIILAQQEMCRINVHVWQQEQADGA